MAKELSPASNLKDSKKTFFKRKSTSVLKPPDICPDIMSEMADPGIVSRSEGGEVISTGMGKIQIWVKSQVIEAIKRKFGMPLNRSSFSCNKAWIIDV